MQVDLTALAAAADNLTNLGTVIDEGNAVAAAPITSVFPAAADEVSAMISQVLNGHGEWWQTLAAQARAFHEQFVQTLGAAGAAYQNAEVTAEQMLRSGIGQLEQPFAPLIGQLETGTVGPVSMPPPPSVVNSTVALLAGGSTFPVLSGQTVGQIMNSFIMPNFLGALGSAIYTPEQFWPLTPLLGNLTLDQSIAQGTALLNNAIETELGSGNNVVVWGSSQSAAVITDEIRNLMAMGSPDVSKLSFTLTGNPNTPNGGPFERFAGLYIPGLDVLFNGATPPDSPYPTTIFSNQYDPVANFPRYPLNLVSDANALAGFMFGQHDYAGLTATQVANAIQLPTSPGYTGATTYYERLAQNLPLVEPLRVFGGPYGSALADLLQPDLRVLSDLGYGSGEYANIPTPASLFELPNPFTVGPDLVNGTIQGTEAALVDLGFLPQSYYPLGSYPFSPVLDPGLNFPLPQSSVTGLSLLTGFEGALTALTGLEG